jgi:phosphoribosylformimino-5-aminoimidazole carboxamide ribotide isomerase
MKLFPAIDLKNGQCVRLTQGDFDMITIYESDPLKQAQKFAEAGAEWLHVVDLDGAKAGEMQQFDIIARLANETKLKIQAGGGVRREKTIAKLLEAGAQRVVIGSLAVKNRALVEGWIKQFGADRIIIAFDIRLTADGQPEILTHGWQAGSSQLLWDVIEAYTASSGLRTILCTDVSRDGMLTGTNHDLYRRLKTQYPTLDILASGGVSGTEDLTTLNEIGVAGAIIGKALYEGKIDLAAEIGKFKHAD